MPKILLVEDDPFITEIYSKKFDSSGLTTTVAKTGKEALKQAAAGSFDLVMLDMVLPELSGMDILRELRTKAEYDKGLKVVVFSNLSGPEEREEALKAGANGFISKTDFTPTQVVDEVKRYLDRFASEGKSITPETATSAAMSEVLVDELPEAGDEKRVLLIEDEPVFVEMFGKALRDAGYGVVAERDGQAGLTRAQSGQFDLVITDHMLPSVSGRDIIAALRGSDATKGTPIFLLTASMEAGGVKALEESGAADRSFMKTEITPLELATAVKEFFAAKNDPQEK